MFAMGMIFILLVYVVLDKLLLLPVRKVVSALQAESHGGQETLLPTPNSQETLQLINAFKDMRKQIHSRQDALEYQALHDSLTGLANRHLLFDRLQQAIQHARRQQQSLAFYILDLDRFKEINDTMGHQVGDSLLEEVGLRLTETLRDTDTVARLGGDEFAILIEDCNLSKAIHVANKILSAFEQTYHVNNLHLYLNVSIGIAFYPEHDHSAQGLIQRADIAMYVAKRSKNGYAIYDINQDQHSINRLALDSDLRAALEDTEQLMLFYQPKQDLESNRVSEVEALLRWQHPEHGLVPPTEIIPLAEQTGLIQSLTYWVVEAAIKQHLAWRQESLMINIAINISTHNLQDKNFFPNIETLLLRYQVSGDFLIFELTESAMMSDPAHAIASITAFCKLGIQFSIDDFGTGFSSLSYLKQLPAHELKIDKSFVMNMHNNDNDAVIVRSIIELAHNLSLRVVAEGVEDKDTLDLLSILDCDAVQGFYIQRPASAGDITEWLSNHYKVKEKQTTWLT
jgi:diguanylate cyclase (GGDEF)-like protein